MFLYVIINKVSGTKYYGITVNPKQRMAAHRSAAKNKRHKSPLCCAMQSYGIDNFVMEALEEGTAEYIAQQEIALIASDDTCYNLHRGGHIGFDIRLKGQEAVASWTGKLKAARAGRKPALGMKHSAETKKLCGEYGKLRWDIHGRYPQKVLDYGFKESNKRFGISKTHYYRLLKAAAK